MGMIASDARREDTTLCPISFSTSLQAFSKRDNLSRFHFPLLLEVVKSCQFIRKNVLFRLYCVEIKYKYYEYDLWLYSRKF